MNFLCKKNILLGIILGQILSLFAVDEPVESKTVQDWKLGKIHSKITLDLPKAQLNLPSDRHAASKIIERESPSLLKDMYLYLLVDSSHRVGHYLAEGKVSLNDINKIIDKGEKTPVHLTTEVNTAVVYHSSLMTEIAKLFVKHKNPYKPLVPIETTASKVYSGIIIDARGGLPVHGEYIDDKLEPALFPKIWNQDMSLIYEKNIVSPEIAIKQGIVTYSTTLNESEYQKKIGTNPLRIIARGVFGQNRTDPIIANNDAAKILSKPENLKLLEEGKIVILCDPEVIQVAEVTHLPNENFYFVYHDIEKHLFDKRPESIILKAPKPPNIVITMYGIRFIADSPEILPSEHRRVDIVADALKKMEPTAQFLIEGHTANLNKPQGELQLSIQRAEKMAEELSKRGIDASRIKTAGYGSTKPIAPSDTGENRAKNRRVEITIIRE